MALGLLTHGMIAPGGSGGAITIYVPVPVARFRGRFIAPRFRARMQVR